GKIGHSYVQGKFGEELRLSEKEVRSMAGQLSNGAGKGRQDSADSPGEGSLATLSIQELWQAYQALQQDYRNAAGQIGYLKAKADEVPLLSQRAESLIKENEGLKKVKDEMAEQNAQLDELKTKLEADLKDNKGRVRWQSRFTVVLVVLAFLIGVAIARYREILDLLTP
ncbi:MAG: hypothetical protein HYV04_06530, partial [Deltaproteobacteria bacterium]|nr:hypothetical protein [Deltaproteobacteria bacterium]